MDTEIILTLLDRPVAYHRVFALIGGSVTAGLFLSQVFYWAKRTNDPAGWFWKTQEEWQEETCLSRYEQESARKALRELGILEEKRAGSPARLYYRLNVPALIAAIENVLSVGKNHNPDCGKTTFKNAENQQTGTRETSNQECGKPAIFNTEITTETTTDIKSSSRKKKREEPSDNPEEIGDRKEKQKIYFRLAQALADVTGVAFEANRAMLMREAKALSSVATPEQILRDYGVGGVWFKKDWRGQKNQRPSPAQVRQTWGTFLELQPAPVFAPPATVTNGGGAPVDVEELSEFNRNLLKRLGQLP